MSIFAIFVTIAAWGCVLFWRGSWARVAQLMVFGTLGAVFALAGGFSYWWDASREPGRTVFICGVLTLLSQAGTFVVGLLAHEGGMAWPGDDDKPRRPPLRRRPPPK